MKCRILTALVVSLAPVLCVAQGVAIRVDARDAGKPVSPYLTGACIEDVNHEIYGGLYSQMIFGESFQEPARTAPVKGFFATDGEWRAAAEELSGGAGAGPKLVKEGESFVAGEAGVQIYFDGPAAGNAGLIVRLSRAAAGADRFDGYEIAIDVARKRVVIGRHQQDFRLLKEVECDVAPGRWIALATKFTRDHIEVLVDGKSLADVDDPRPLPAGTVGLRQWQRPARYRQLWTARDGRRTDVAFEPAPDEAVAVSGMWRAIDPRAGGTLTAAVEKELPFVGAQSQRVTLAGDGDAGIENQGLNRWGMSYKTGKPYEGYLWLRAGKPVAVYASLESRDGERRYAETKIDVGGDDQWRRFEFAMTPDTTDPAGRFAIRLKSPGSVVVGHAFLQPGDWGRYKNLPVRRDVVEGLKEQGVTVLRYGGSAANAPQYRWKKMIGPRDRRPPYVGNWYPYTSNGWGIIDFLDVCEAAGFLGIPDFNIDETAQDMTDFIEYVNGASDTEWGKRRAADGHPQPYRLTHIELGNEERVDDAYYQKFERLAPAIWAKDPNVILVVGDFQYERPITDPMHVEGAASKVTSLAAHRRILELAKKNNREVWFDVHMWTSGLMPSTSARAFTSYVDAIDRLADGAKHHVAIFEFNANSHDVRRALANADAIGLVTRDARVPVALSANCLQPDGQNDNGWNQGLLFLNPAKTWLQPTGYVTQMVAKAYQPRVIEAHVDNAGDRFKVTATRSDDGKHVVLQVVNLDANAAPAKIAIDNFTPTRPTADVEELAGDLDATNTTANPTNVTPKHQTWTHGLAGGAGAYTFPPHSFTVIQLN